jgi:hypothetical protein
VRGGEWDVLGTDTRGRLYGVSTQNRSSLKRFDTSGVVPMEFNFGGNGDPVVALAFDLNDMAYVTTGSNAFRFNASTAGDGGSIVVDAGVPLAGTNEFFGPVARIPDGGVFVGGNQLYAFDGMNWVMGVGPLPFGGSPVTAMATSGPNLWVFGEGNVLKEGASRLTGMALPTTALGATTAPGDEAWVVGSHGLLARAKVGGSNTLAAAVHSNDIRNLFITDNVAYAAENEAILFRNNATWIENPRLSGPSNGHTWVAVAAVPAPDGGQVVWAIDRPGFLYRDDGTRTSGQVVLQLAPPFVDYFPRSAATLPLPDGGALLGYGKVIVRLTADEALHYDGGTILEGVTPDGGTPADFFVTPVDMISGLAQTNQALVVTGHMDQAKTSRLYVFKGSWGVPLVETPINQLIEDVTVCPSGSFVAAGNHALLKRLGADGTGVTDGLMGTMPSGVDFASVWCGPNDEAWVLSRSGDVLRFGTSGIPTRERTGWGRRDNNTDPVDACTIRGNDRFIYISGGSSALISRPVCP